MRSVRPELDEKWAKVWADKASELAKPESLDKRYILSMFPYPSGMLHMGHLRVYTINDVLARFHRLRNRTVVNPMGWDSFGLPAENAARQRKLNPKDWTNSNIAKMKQQLDKMLATFDWDRELSTCSPEYYKHTQQIFLWLYEHGLAYKRFKEINWDPVDQTVLANEQVDSNGKSWRSGALVEKKVLNQWFLKITDFAGELEKDLQLLKQWPSKVKLMQRNWIGKSEGCIIKFFIGSNPYCDEHDITVFTTRPDTIFGVQYLALSLDHPVTKAAAQDVPELLEFVTAAKEEETKNSYSYSENDKQNKNKKGFLVPGIHAVNPVGSSEKPIPIYVSPYVISGYGPGAVMGVPGHDQRDFDFWRENSTEPAIKVIDPVDGDVKDGVYTKKRGVLNQNNDKAYAGFTVEEAAKVIAHNLLRSNSGGVATNFKLRDWLISRQRYWGCPIPIIHCGDCGIVPVPAKDLPVRLPEMTELVSKGNPLDSHTEFIKCKCPSCGKPAKRETDTMDTFMDSSWYFFRFLDVNNTKEPFSAAAANANMPVDLYLGGIEHAILHLLYSRFLSKFLKKIGKWDGGDLNGEPFRRLVSQGMVHGKTYIHPETGQFMKPEEVELLKFQADPIVPEVSYEKMSKSKFNGVDPVECIEKYGADATRAHILFQAPVEQVLLWDETKISGIERWLTKLTRLVDTVLYDYAETVGTGCAETIEDVLRANEKYVSDKKEVSDAEKNIHNTIHKYVKKLDGSFDAKLSLNTVISDYMKLTNALIAGHPNVDIQLMFNYVTKLLVMVSPVCPATAEELWLKIQDALHVKWNSISRQSWPDFSNDVTFQSYAVHVDGTFRFKFESTPTLVEAETLDVVRKHADGQRSIIKYVKSVLVSKERNRNYIYILTASPKKFE